MQPAPLEFRVACGEEPLELFSPRQRHWRDLDRCPDEGLEDVSDRVTVEMEVVRLVGITHQAVVTRGLAGLPGPGRTAGVLATDLVEVTELKRAEGDSAERVRVGGELAQHTRATFGGFIEEELTAVVAVR